MQYIINIRIKNQNKFELLTLAQNSTLRKQYLFDKYFTGNETNYKYILFTFQPRKQSLLPPLSLGLKVCKFSLSGHLRGTLHTSLEYQPHLCTLHYLCMGIFNGIRALYSKYLEVFLHYTACISRYLHTSLQVARGISWAMPNGPPTFWLAISGSSKASHPC